MKAKIKVIAKNIKCLPSIIDQGDWIDLATSEKVVMKAPYAKMLHKHKKSGEGEGAAVIDRYREVVFDYQQIPLGVAMKLPAGYEAIVVPRSSLFRKCGLQLVNSQGVIDGSFSGNDNIWHFFATSTRNVSIEVGSKIAQFRIQLSQKATVWQKIKWLFTSGIEIEQVDSLDAPNRGDSGSTGNINVIEK